MKGIKLLAFALVAIMLASAFAGVVDASVEHPNVEPKEEANNPIDVEDRGIEAQHSESLSDIDPRFINGAREREFERESAYRERHHSEHESPWRDGEGAHDDRFGELGQAYMHAFEDEDYFDEPYLEREFGRNRLPQRKFTPAPPPQINWAR